MARPRGTDSARVIQVIETKAIRGIGTSKDPVREVTQYWDFEGNFLAEIENVAEVSENGYVTVYHRTTADNAR